MITRLLIKLPIDDFRWDGAIRMGQNIRINWIDCAKTVAIIAVIVDHCNGLLYTNFKIAQASYYSTSLFILLGGISASLSFGKENALEKYRTFEKIKKIYVQYAIATLILTCYYNKFFDLKIYLFHLINFSAATPYYYFVFLFQLIIISPFLIRWCRFCQRQKLKLFWHLGTMGILCFMAAISINYTYILAVHGGGKYLWGGTYCLLYYIGIFLKEMECFKNRNKKIRLIVLPILFGAWILWWNGLCKGSVVIIDRWLEFFWGEGFNPPGISFMVFAVITLFLCYVFFSLLDEMNEIRVVKWCINVLTWIGRNTLYIFMYHLLVIDVERRICSKLNIELTGINARIIFFIGAIIIPVLAKEFILRFYKKITIMMRE